MKVKLKSERENIRKVMTMLLFFIGIYVAISFAAGSRFTPDQALKVSEWIDHTSVLLGKVDSDKYQVYVYENSDVYRTIVVEYKFPFWRQNVSSWANKTQDKVKLVGWCSYNDYKNGITVIPVQNFDEQVTYIEMGSDSDLQRKEIKVNEVLLFTWKKSLRWNDLNAVAYSSDNKALYKLGYEINNSTIHADELRWFPAD